MQMIPRFIYHTANPKLQKEELIGTQKVQGYGSKKTASCPTLKKYRAIVLGSKGCDINFQCASETIPTSNEINLLGVTLDSKLKFDAHVASVCRNVGGQVNALNRLKKILPCKVKELLYRAFVLPHFYYCSQVWLHCGSRNTKKIKKVNECALRYVYKHQLIMNCYSDQVQEPRWKTVVSRTC